MNEEQLAAAAETLKESPEILEAVKTAASKANKLDSTTNTLTELSRVKNELATKNESLTQGLAAVGYKDGDDLTSFLTGLKTPATPVAPATPTEPTAPTDNQPSPAMQAMAAQMASTEKQLKAINQELENKKAQVLKQKNIDFLSQSFHKEVTVTDENGVATKIVRPTHAGLEYILGEHANNLVEISGKKYFKNPNDPNVPIVFEDGLKAIMENPTVKGMELNLAAVGAGVQPTGQPKPKEPDRDNQKGLEFVRNMRKRTY